MLETIFSTVPGCLRKTRLDSHYVDVANTCWLFVCKWSLWGRTCDAFECRRAEGCSWWPDEHFWRCSCSNRNRKTWVAGCAGSVVNLGNIPGEVSEGNRPPCAELFCKWSYRRAWRRKWTPRRRDWLARPLVRSRAMRERDLFRFRKGDERIGMRMARRYGIGTQNTDAPEFFVTTRHE